MKTLIFFLTLTALTIITRPVWADAAPAAPTQQLGVPPIIAPVPAADASATPPPPDGQANGPAIPTGGFDAARYEVLWTKSPFAVATSEDVATESPDYSFVGFAANVDGVSYASLIEKDDNSHFLISTDKPVKGMTLTSINRSKDGSETYVIVQKDGQPITLKLEQAPQSAVAPPPPGMSMPNMPAPMATNPPPGVSVPQMAAPGSQPAFPNNPAARPFPRFHRQPIHLPPMPSQPGAQTPPPPAPAQAPAH